MNGVINRNHVKQDQRCKSCNKVPNCEYSPGSHSVRRVLETARAVLCQTFQSSHCYKQHNHVVTCSEQPVTEQVKQIIHRTLSQIQRKLTEKVQKADLDGN